LCAAVPKPKSDTHRKSVSPSVVNRGARNTAEGKPFVPDLARHRKESAMRGRKRRLVRHQRIWRATMKCCASTFAYALTGPFSGNASRRNPGAGPGLPVPENDTCGPTTPTQHERRIDDGSCTSGARGVTRVRASTGWLPETVQPPSHRHTVTPSFKSGLTLRHFSDRGLQPSGWSRWLLENTRWLPEAVQPPSHRHTVTPSFKSDLTLRRPRAPTLSSYCRFAYL
jgi:hypothetical protein